MDLIVIESPNKVKNVVKYAAQAGLKAAVIATGGHIVDLPPMKEGPCVDLDRFEGARLVPRNSSSASTLARLKAAIARADRVIVASDGDREGEAIAAEVWPLIPRGKAWRARFEEITAAGVASGLRALEPQLNEGKVAAATARRMIDRLAGWHATSVVFAHLRQHKGISAGRLQSAALRLVVDRHREHGAFKPTTTFGVRVRLRTVSGHEFAARAVDQSGEPLVFPTKDAASTLAVGQVATVSAVKATRNKQRPRPPFTATSWLQVAQQALGLTIKDATAATQSLFEDGRTTYPRTDSVRVSDEAIAWARTELARRFGAELVPSEAWVHKDAESDAQGAHEAIRPTVPHDDDDHGSQSRTEGQWGEAYQLIETRFLASQAAARLVDLTVVDFECGSARLRARGEVEAFDGWRRVLRTDAAEEAERADPKADVGDDSPSALPKLAEVDQVEVVSREVVTITTKPRPLFSQASLVAELKRLGIGRPSTYSVVVPLIISRGWAVERLPSELSGARRKKRELPVLVPSHVGEDLVEFLKTAFPGLVDYEFTARLERELDRIDAGKNTRQAVGKEWWQRFEVELRGAAALPGGDTNRKDLGPCPKCAGEGRSGRLRLLKGISRSTSKPYEFAACDADTKDKKVCGYTAAASGGELAKLASCPTCSVELSPATKSDGTRALVCSAHGSFLADSRWQRVTAPRCARCGKEMAHRRSRESRGGYVWACYADQYFVDADAHGAAAAPGRKRTRS